MDQITELLTRGVEKIYPSKEALEKVLRSGKKLKLYQGFDPSMPSLHLGNLVGLMKLRQFQKLGHEVIFLIGDFTGMIGDPSGKSDARKPLTREQVLENSKSYKEQASRVLDFEGNNPTEILYNSEWLAKLSFAELLKLSSKLTYQQVKERDMFQKREKEGKDIYLNEFLYPLMQGYDSVYMDVDLEIGGSDQLFNMMTGRDLMHKLKGKEKFVLTTKLLVDKEGNKVGKTTGNALFLDSTPENFYGGIMSFPDETIALGFELLTEVPLEGIEDKIKKDPMGEKKRLAQEVTKILWGEELAIPSEEAFEETFQEKKPEYKTEINPEKTLSGTVAASSGASISQAKRLIKEGAVDVNEITKTDPPYHPKPGDKIKFGKKTFWKVK